MSLGNDLSEDWPADAGHASTPVAAAPRRKARRVRVGADVFRWVSSHGSTGMSLTIQWADGDGQPLCVEFDYLLLDPRSVREVFRPVINHGLIGRLIAQALQDGWTPQQDLPPHTIDRLQASRFVSAADYRRSRRLALPQPELTP